MSKEQFEQSIYLYLANLNDRLSLEAAFAKVPKAAIQV